MHSRAALFSAVWLVLTCAPAEAATISFRATKKDTAWACQDASKPDTNRDGLTISVLIDGAPDATKVVLQAKYSDAGAEKTAPVPHGQKTLWTFTDKNAKPDADSALTVEGTIDGVNVKCAASITFAAQVPTPKPVGTLPAATRFTKLDALADTWLQSSAGISAVQLLIDRITTGQGIAMDKVLILRHLPSGATAFPYPASVSEHQVMQIAMVVNLRDLSSVEVNFANCERPLRERIRGDFGEFAARAEGAAEPPPDFVLKPIGSLFQCGPESMAYSLTVATEGSTEKPTPAPARVEVRPVYHLGATAIMGFDWTKQPTFSGKSGTVAMSEDQFGPSLFVGGTWFPFGVDYGRMRSWNYWLNPFVAVSLESPKEHFIVGTALTVTGGISVAIGGAFHKIDELDGHKVGDAFTGDGNVPTVKRWSKAGRGFFIGVAVDNNVFNALKSIGAPAAPGGAK